MFCIKIAKEEVFKNKMITILYITLVLIKLLISNIVEYLINESRGFTIIENRYTYVYKIY